MAISLVQTKGAGSANTTGTSLAAAWGGNTTGGNTIIVVTGLLGANTISSITDSQSNTYTKIDSIGNTGDLEIWYAKNITGGTLPTITVTASAADGIGWIAREYSGLDTVAPLDVHANAGGNSAAPSVTTATTTVANELVIGAAMNTSAAATYTAGSGFANIVNQATTNTGTQAHIGMEDKTIIATGAQIVPLTQSGAGVWDMVAATFKAAGAGSTVKPQLMMMGIGS